MKVLAAALVVAMLASGCEATRTSDAKQSDRSVAAGPADSAIRATGTSDRRSGWPMHGRDAWEQRYSPLDAINSLNVSKLGLAWAVDLGTNRGIEATPIVVNGVLYLSSAWSVVHAFDAATGKPLWRYDPKVPRARAKLFCCGVVNRGVAHHRGRIFFGTLDGRLIALDAKTGRRIWETLTVDPEKPYSITGAPRVVRGHVIIGNAGADLGVRGYVSAYDRDTGKLVWRFYTVPGPPDQPQESKSLERALPSWKGDLWWQVGGGGTVWDAMAYDRALDLLFIGTGNGSPMGASPAKSGRRRQSLPVVDPGAAPRDGRARLALPDDSRRQLGFHRDPEPDRRRPRARAGHEAAGRDAGAEERLLSMSSMRRRGSCCPPSPSPR